MGGMGKEGTENMHMCSQGQEARKEVTRYMHTCMCANTRKLGKEDVSACEQRGEGGCGTYK